MQITKQALAILSPISGNEQSDISVTRALNFIKFCCDEDGDEEEEVLSTPNLIDYALGCPQLLTKFVDTLKDKWGIGQSGQML